MINKMHLAALQMVSGIGSAKLKMLLNYFGSAQNAWQAERDDLILANIGEAVCDNLVKYRQKANLEKLFAEWGKKQIKICSIDEPEYPFLLKNIYNPPYLLYYKGTLPQSEKLIAVVGSRKASAYGKNAARLLAADLAATDIIIVSGAARGIDTAAHQGALLSGSTIAVLGSGVDVVYPPENGSLLERIAETGAVISEYSPGTAPHSGNFPVRNRIISGLSRGVIIIEAGQRSGALITADYALDEGRDVFVVPGNIFDDGSKGVNALIKTGAKLIDSAADVLEEYDWQSDLRIKKSVSGNLNKKPTEFISAPSEKDEAKSAEPKINLSGDEKIIYNVLERDKPLNLEEIVIKSKLPLPLAAYILLQLGLNGLVVELSGRNYIRSQGGK